MPSQKHIEILKAQIINELDSQINRLTKEIHRLEAEKKRRLKGLAIASGESTAKGKKKKDFGTNIFQTLLIPVKPPKGSTIQKIRDFIGNTSAPFTTRQVIDYLEKEGLKPVQSSVSTTLIRLAEKGLIKEIERKGRMAIYQKAA